MTDVKGCMPPVNDAQLVPSLAVFAEPRSLTMSSVDDGNHDNDVTIPDDCHQKEQPFSHSATNGDGTNPYPPTLGEHCDTNKEKDDVISSSNGTTNALELLMGQYNDSDSELEPGEVL